MTQAPSPAKRQRSAARLFATQALFQMEAAGTDLKDVQQEFETHRFGAEIEGETWPEGDIDLFRALLMGAYDRQAKIDQLTDTALVEKWPIARIDPTLRALLRAAGAELLTQTTPPKVAITEYVDVAKAFVANGKEPKLVIAVRDPMARAISP
ncbi:MAG: transcription antitermination factor NusB, partial [Pseudomonadota bacterium]